MKGRLYLISAIILLVGLGSAILIYLSARNDTEGAPGYEVIDGIAYPVWPDDSKMYVHDLELYGGKTILLVDEFRRWFVGLWQGRSLSFTVAGITIVASSGVFFFANRLSSDPEPDAGDNNTPPG
jgi:hypothetical protein